MDSAYLKLAIAISISAAVMFFLTYAMIDGFDHFYSAWLTKAPAKSLRGIGGRPDGTLQELADEAFDDLLKKHDRPVWIRAMLKGSRLKALDKGTSLKFAPAQKNKRVGWRAAIDPAASRRKLAKETWPPPSTTSFF